MSSRRSDARAVVWNTGVQMASKVAVLALGAVSIAVLTRYLGADDYGKIAVALAYLALFGVLADLGLFTVVVREISRTPERTEHLVGTTMTLRVALGLATVAIAAPVSLLLPYDAEVRVAILISAVPFVLGLVTTAITAVFQARLRMERTSIAETAGRATALLAVLVVVWLDLGFYAVVATAAVGALVAFGLSWALARDLVRLRPRIDARAWRTLLVLALPVGLTLAVTEIYFRADTLIISIFRDFDEVGAYALAYRIFELCALVPGVLLAAVFPLLSRDLAADPDRARGTLQAATDAFLVFGLPLAAGALVIAPEIVRLAAGEGFGEAADPLRILMCAGAVASVNGLLGYALIARDRQRDALVVAASGLVLNVALNFALVPSFGIVAAAAVTAGSEVLIFAGTLWFVRKRLGYVPGFAMALRAGLAAAIMATVLWPIRHETAALTIPAGAVAYLAALYPLGGGALLRRLRAS